MSYRVISRLTLAVSLAAAIGLSSGCSLASASEHPTEIAGTITWSMTRQYEDPISASRRESETTTVAMDVALKIVTSRAGVTLFQARDGKWTATGTGASEQHAAGCTMTRATEVALGGTFEPAANVVTLVHTQSARRGLLNFSVSKGDGAVIATTRYCDGREVAQNRTYFWALSDAAVDVSVERGDDGRMQFIVSKEQTAPCGPGATCTRTASGVLNAISPAA